MNRYDVIEKCLKEKEKVDESLDRIQEAVEIEESNVDESDRDDDSKKKDLRSKKYFRRGDKDKKGEKDKRLSSVVEEGIDATGKELKHQPQFMR